MPRTRPPYPPEFREEAIRLDAANGQINGTPTVAGTTQVQLRVSDNSGTVAESAPLILNIDEAPAKGIVPTEGRPAISRLRQSHYRWREGRRLAKTSSLAARRKRRRIPLGTTFAFNLNTEATVMFAFARQDGKHFMKTAGLSFAGHPGANRVTFQGRISHHEKLRPGHYKLVATAKGGGVRSKPRSLIFTIAR